MGEDFLNRHWSVEVFANRNAWVYLPKAMNEFSKFYTSKVH